MDESDLKQISDIFGPLVFIAYGNGTVHVEYIKEICHDWIYDIPPKTLSNTARFVLALEELRGRVINDDSNATNQGSVILTNSVWSARQKSVAINNLQMEIDKLNLAAQKEVDRATKHEYLLGFIDCIVQYAQADLVIAGKFDSDQATWKNGVPGGPKICAKVVGDVYNFLVPDSQKSKPRPTTKSAKQAALAEIIRARCT